MAFACYARLRAAHVPRGRPLILQGSYPAGAPGGAWSKVQFAGFQIGEVTCPTKYFKEASSINFKRSIVYGLGVLRTSLAYRLHSWGLIQSRLFAASGARLEPPADAVAGAPQDARRVTSRTGR